MCKVIYRVYTLKILSRINLKFLETKPKTRATASDILSIYNKVVKQNILIWLGSQSFHWPRFNADLFSNRTLNRCCYMFMTCIPPSVFSHYSVINVGLQSLKGVFPLDLIFFVLSKIFCPINKIHSLIVNSSRIQ